MIKPEQIRMARAALKWGVRELAKKANLTPNTVSRVENGAESLVGTLEKIAAALEKAGIEFIEPNGGGPGVRLRKPKK